MGNSSTFIKVTNQDIYKKILEVEKKIDESNITLTQHSLKISHNRKLIASLFTIVIMIIGYLIQFVLGGK